jgi:cation diffusion facilitator family transporter
VILTSLEEFSISTNRIATAQTQIQNQALRSQAASLALVVTIVLTFGKLLVGFWTGSLGVIAEGIHSFLDLISAAIAFFTIREAGKPADEEHAFGHGKIETVSSFIESALLIVAAIIIFYEGFDRLYHPVSVQQEGIAILIIFLSLLVSVWIYRHNLQVAELTESSAIRVNAYHFLTDSVSSLAVLIGLILIYFTQWTWIDPVMAFGVGAYVAKIGFQSVKKSLGELVDEQLPIEEREQISKILGEFIGKIIKVEGLRTRRSGVVRYMDFNLIVCGHMSVQESHDICNAVEARLEEEFSHASVTIHVEPCADVKPKCDVNCSLPGRKS